MATFRRKVKLCLQAVVVLRGTSFKLLWEGGRKGVDLSLFPFFFSSLFLLASVENPFSK